MTAVPIAPDLGAWLVLRRAQWAGLTLDVYSGIVFDQGKRLPSYLIPHAHQLVDRGYLRLTDPIPDAPLCRRVIITDTGERLLDLLYDLRQCWLAKRRAGLPRSPADLDVLAGVLDGLHRQSVSPGHR